MKGLDLKEISGDRITSTLRDVVEKRLGSKDVDICIEAGSKKGDNFIGEIYRILYKCENDTKQSSLILKMAAQNMARREKFNLSAFFARETRVYKEILPLFFDFQILKGIIPREHGFNEYAKCYKIIEDTLSESLFLEDLRLDNFIMLDHRKEDLTFEHVALVMKALGKFHAISFALRDQQPNKFAQVTSNLTEMYYRANDKDFVIFLNSVGNRTIKTLNEANHTELSAKFARSIEKGFAEAGVECVTGELAEPYAVLCHGDVWINNTMFRYDDNGKPIQVKLIDWQFARYASPVVDIILCLLSCTRKELRDKHYDELVMIYYESLSSFLKRLGSDPEKLFPFSALLDQLKKFGKYGTITGAVLLLIFAADPKTIPDLSELSEKMNEYEGALDDLLSVAEYSKDDFSRKLSDLIGDSVRFGYI